MIYRTKAANERLQDDTKRLIKSIDDPRYWTDNLAQSYWGYSKRLGRDGEDIEKDTRDLQAVAARAEGIDVEGPIGLGRTLVAQANSFPTNP